MQPGPRTLLTYKTRTADTPAQKRENLLKAQKPPITTIYQTRLSHHIIVSDAGETITYRDQDLVEISKLDRDFRNSECETQICAFCQSLIMNFVSK